MAEVRVSTAETLGAFRAAELVGWRDRQRFKDALGAVLAKSRAERDAFDDCFDKESLVERLVQARLREIADKAASMPSSTGAAKGVDFGAETRLGEDDDSEAVFRAAGWSGEQAEDDTSRVDQDRSPGLNRNFGKDSQSDFKKPWSGGGREKYRT